MTYSERLQPLLILARTNPTFLPEIPPLTDFPQQASRGPEDRRGSEIRRGNVCVYDCSDFCRLSADDFTIERTKGIMIGFKRQVC